MKKVITALFIVFVLSLFYNTYRTPKLYDGKSTYRIYTYSQTYFKDSICDVLSGENVVTIKDTDLSTAMTKIGNYNSYETSFVGDEDAAREQIYRLNATIIKTEKGDTGITFYCFSNRFQNHILLDGERVNLHVIVRNDTVTIASPVIRGCA